MSLSFSSSLPDRYKDLGKSNGCLVNLVEAHSQTCCPSQRTSVTGLLRRCVDLIIEISTKQPKRRTYLFAYVEKGVEDSETQEDGRELRITNIGSCKLFGKDTGESGSDEQRQGLHAVLVCSFGTFEGREDSRRQGLLHVLYITLASAVGV